MATRPSTSEPIDSLPLGVAAQVDSSFSMLDLVANRSGKPVAGCARSPVGDKRYTQVQQLRRWTGVVCGKTLAARS